MGQRADTGQTHREVLVVCVCEADASGLDEQAELLGIDRRNRCRCIGPVTKQRIGLFA